MSVAPGDPNLDLTPQAHNRGFSCFTCCLPKQREIENDDEMDKDRNFDLPDLGDQEASKPGTAANTQHNILITFLQMIFAFLLFNFDSETRPKAIAASESSTPVKNDHERVTVSEDGEVEVEDLPVE